MNGKHRTPIAVLLLFAFAGFIFPEEGVKPKMDTFTYGKDVLNIHFYGHASLMLDFNGLLIYVDPVSQFADYATLPKADVILVTHEHGDHLDPAAIAAVTKNGTVIAVNRNSETLLKKGTVLKNGQSIEAKGIRIQAVPAYNTTKGHEQYHPKGQGNGYVLSLGGERVYIAGDTEDIPEMRDLKNIDIAFLPVNQPYTMTPEQLKAAILMLKPKIVYPYHLGNTDTTSIEKALSGIDGIDVRMRNMK